jgi:long-subunit fatty acid transport protein
MKKLLLILTSTMLIPYLAYGGGIVTNTNQSATWSRTLVRDASTGIDAVYFNPAGLTKLDNGLHFSLNSQTIWQTKDVTTTYAYLQPNPKTYKGDVFAPIFPSLYAAWKKGKVAVSFGFNPIGGGGGAEYKTGLASFESQIATLPFLITALSTQMGAPVPTTQYAADIYFKGSSIFFGYQLGFTYAINDMISAYAGARLVTAKNTYEGHINDIMINPIIPGLNPTGAMISAYGLFTSPALASTPYAAFAPYVANKEIDATEKGTSFCPILGVNLAFIDNKLDIGIKYEFKTNLELTQKINSGVEVSHVFEQDSVVNSNLPAMLSVGASYEFIPRFTASAGFHYYFDKSANYGKTLDADPLVSVKNEKLMDKNFFEFALGLEYGITEKLYVSAGYLRGQTGDYQSDLNFSLSSNTFGGGLGYKITDKIMVNLGGGYSIDLDGTKNYTEYIQNPLTGAVITSSAAVDVYSKTSVVLGIGLDISF